jgi:hypothetical protein
MLTYALFELDVAVVVVELVEGETLEFTCDVVRRVSVHVLVLVRLVACRHPSHLGRAPPCHGRNS